MPFAISRDEGDGFVIAFTVQPTVKSPEILCLIRHKAKKSTEFSHLKTRKHQIFGIFTQKDGLR